MQTILSQVAPDTLVNISQLGVAGLMGALWWWERKYSRQREDELTEAHQRIMEQKEHMDTLVNALEQNTKAITEFTAVHQQLVTLLQLRERLDTPQPVRVAS